MTDQKRWYFQKIKRPRVGYNPPPIDTRLPDNPPPAPPSKRVRVLKIKIGK
jgi:hypothetical protein